jgi:NAD(P)H-flavin reductase
MSGEANNAERTMAADPMTPRFLSLRRVVHETADTATLYLEDPNPPSLFAPGQFSMLYLFGAGEVAISISSDPHDPGLTGYTIRAAGSVTGPLLALKRGSMVGVRGPYGRGWPLAQLKHGGNVVLIAGGIGLAPLRPVIYQLLRESKSTRRVILVYGARTPADLLYQREVGRWRSHTRFEAHVIVDCGDSPWRGRVGIITDLLDSLTFDANDAAAMLCGPEVMMRVCARALLQRGVAESRMYLSIERNMKCAIGTCGHCQFGPVFICKDGPVFELPRIARLLGIREV